jgi:GntP family gluconate:H+ symporter
MNPQDWKLIALALLAIGTLVLLITKARINAFISLLLASLVVGVGAAVLLGVPARDTAGRVILDAAGKTSPYGILAVIKSFGDGLGATMSGTAAVIALGTMLGKLLAESGGAEVLAKRFAGFFGPKHIQWCIMALALAVGLTTWFAVGLVLLLPILLTLTHETRQPFIRLTLPLLSCLSVMHGVMPPHPGPVVAVEALKASMGLVLFWGMVIGIPTAAVAGPIYAKFIVNRITANPPPIPRKSQSGEVGIQLPGFGLTLFSILSPVMLMLLATVAELSLPKGHALREVAQFVGNPTLALLIAVLFATWSLGTRCGYSSTQVLKSTEGSIAAVGMTLLVISAGGGFARVLRDSGVAESIGKAGAAADLSPLIYGWLVSAFIRVATGSATVAITTASGLLVPVMAAHPELNPHQVALIICAIGCGSLFLSHLNDSGFWMVKDSLGLTVGQTLKTWTVCETLVGVAGMVFSLIAFKLMAL